MTHAPGLRLDAATASAAAEAYKQIATLDKLICNAIENVNSCSIWLRTKDGHPIGWDGITGVSEMGQDIRAIVMRRLYENRARYQRQLAQLGFMCAEAPR